MTERKHSLFARIPLAISAFWRTVFEDEFAQGIVRLQQGAGPVRPEPAEKPAALLQETGPAAALQLLGLLQQDGRFIDFIEEDVAGFSDAEIGAAARVVHEGCRKAMREHFTLKPVRSEQDSWHKTIFCPNLWIYWKSMTSIAQGKVWRTLKEKLWWYGRL